MVQSSYKNRKKNRKQSFKRKNTDGNRKVKFIEDDDDKMVGGDNRVAITAFMNKYSKHPIYGVLLAIYSNQKCASLDPKTQLCKDDNTSQLGVSYNNSVIIMDQIHVVDDKPKAPTGKILDIDKLKYVGEVIDYLAQNVFIPKDSIQHVYVQKDDDTWTKLTNGNFNKIQEKELGARTTRSNYPVNDDKVYSESEITKIGEIVANLNTPDKQDDISENIENLKSLVHKPSDDMGSDEFENVVQTLTVGNFDAGALKGAFGTWKTAMLSEITEDDISNLRDRNFSVDSLDGTNANSLNIHEKGERWGSSFGNDIKKKSDIENRASAGASEKVGSSATTGPRQQPDLGNWRKPIQTPRD